MIRTICLCTLVLGLFFGAESVSNAEDYYDYNGFNHQAYWNGYGPGFYGNQRSLQYPVYGAGPYGYGGGSLSSHPYANTYGPPYDNYGNSYYTYGSLGRFGSGYGQQYTPYGYGATPSFNSRF